MKQFAETTSLILNSNKDLVDHELLKSFAVRHQGAQAERPPAKDREPGGAAEGEGQPAGALQVQAERGPGADLHLGGDAHQSGGGAERQGQAGASKNSNSNLK